MILKQFQGRWQQDRHQPHRAQSEEQLLLLLLLLPQLFHLQLVVVHVPLLFHFLGLRRCDGADNKRQLSHGDGSLLHSKGPWKALGGGPDPSPNTEGGLVPSSPSKLKGGAGKFSVLWTGKGPDTHWKILGTTF